MTVRWRRLSASDVTLGSTLQCALRTDRLDREGRWSQSRRHRLAERRLRRPVRFAVAKSPCYRRLYAGLDPNRVRLKDLPPVTKELLRANLDDVLTDRAVAQTDLVAVVADTASFGTWYLGRYAVSHTSGSPGARRWRRGAAPQAEAAAGQQDP